MNKKEIGAMKARMVAGLKDSIEESLLERFVENFEEWQGKLKSVNAVINYIDPEIQAYGYDEFCKKIIEITKNSLEKSVDYEKLFLTRSEYSKIIKENDEDRVEQAMRNELNKKIIDHLMIVLSKEQFKEPIRFKLKEKFALIEDKFDQSMEIANLILKTHEEKEE